MNPTPEVCVGAIIFDNHGWLLLVKRGRGAAVGQWSVPGGRVEPGETLEHAVEREVLEETGLAVRCGPFIGWVQRISAEHHFVIMDFLAELQSPVSGGQQQPMAGDDAADVAWVSIDRLDRCDLVDGLLEFLADHNLV